MPRVLVRRRRKSRISISTPYSEVAGPWAGTDTYNLCNLDLGSTSLGKHPLVSSDYPWHLQTLYSIPPLS